jgi:hypothetical protein
VGVSVPGWSPDVAISTRRRRFGSILASALSYRRSGQRRIRSEVGATKSLGSSAGERSPYIAGLWEKPSGSGLGARKIPRRYFPRVATSPAAIDRPFLSGCVRRRRARARRRGAEIRGGGLGRRGAGGWGVLATAGRRGRGEEKPRRSRTEGLVLVHARDRLAARTNNGRTLGAVVAGARGGQRGPVGLGGGGEG